MPRQIQWKPRLLHPSIATSRTIANLSALAELLTWRMMTQCDDQGRLDADPRLIKATCVPLRDEITFENIPVLLDEMQREMVWIYNDDSYNGPIVQFRTWWESQSPQWSYPSFLPKRPGWTDHLRYRVKGKPIQQNWPPPKNGEDTGQPPLIPGANHVPEEKVKEKVEEEEEGKPVPALSHDKRVIALTKWLAETRGYTSPDVRKEAGHLKWMLEQNYTPDQIKGCFIHMTKDQFWKDKPVLTENIRKNIGQFCKNSETKGAAESYEGEFGNEQ